MINVINISKKYDKNPNIILENISFQVTEGELLLLIGGNGSGKSTLLKCICGIIRPGSGNVLIDDKDSFKNRKRLNKNIGVIFNQKPSLIIDLSVADNFDFLRVIYGVSKAEFKKNMEFFDKYLNIKKLFCKQYRKLSFGERVKIELVSILFFNPKYIFLDEPTIGLDYATKKGLYEILRIRKHEGATIIIISHEIDYIEEICDKVLFLKDGKSIYYGKKDKIFERFQMNQKIIVRYSNIFDDSKLSDFPQIVDHNVSEKNFTFMLENLELKEDYLKMIPEVFDVISIEVGDLKIRGILEDELKNV